MLYKNQKQLVDYLGQLNPGPNSFRVSDEEEGFLDEKAFLIDKISRLKAWEKNYE